MIAETAVSQNTAHLVQHQTRILRVMQHITKQHGVETLILDWEVTAIVRKIIDPRAAVLLPTSSPTTVVPSMLCR